MAKEIKEEILSLTSGLSEAALDSFLKDGLFKDIPLFGSIISVGNLISSISDKMLLMRIFSFIQALEIKTQDEIDEVKEKYFKDEDYKRIGSKILFSLEKIDDASKVKWLAKSFRLYLDKKIDKGQFLRISTIINNSFVNDIEQIVIFKENSRITSVNKLVATHVLDHLYSIGLLENLGFDGGDSSGDAGTVFGLNLFGTIFLNELV